MKERMQGSSEDDPDIERFRRQGSCSHHGFGASIILTCLLLTILFPPVTPFRLRSGLSTDDAQSPVTAPETHQQSLRRWTAWFWKVFFGWRQLPPVEIVVEPVVEAKPPCVGFKSCVLEVLTRFLNFLLFAVKQAWLLLSSPFEWTEQFDAALKEELSLLAEVHSEAVGLIAWLILMNLLVGVFLSISRPHAFLQTLTGHLLSFPFVKAFAEMFAFLHRRTKMNQLAQPKPSPEAERVAALQREVASLREQFGNKVETESFESAVEVAEVQLSTTNLKQLMREVLSDACLSIPQIRDRENEAESSTEPRPPSEVANLLQGLVEALNSNQTSLSRLEAHAAADRARCTNCGKRGCNWRSCTEPRRCFWCGDLSHSLSDCPVKRQGLPQLPLAQRMLKSDANEALNSLMVSLKEMKEDCPDWEVEEMAVGALDALREQRESVSRHEAGDTRRCQWAESQSKWYRIEGCFLVDKMPR